MTDSLIIRVHEVQGTCPVFREGDEFNIANGYILEPSNIRLCMHALSSLLPYYVALSRGIDARDLGLTIPNEVQTGYVQCSDPYKLTGGGTVTFSIRIQK